MSSGNKETLIVPAGCANAFLTLEDKTFVQYFMGDFFDPDSYSGFRYDDPYFNIDWPFLPQVISSKDLSFSDFDPTKI